MAVEPSNHQRTRGPTAPGEHPWKILVLIVLSYVLAAAITSLLDQRLSSGLASLCGTMFLVLPVAWLAHAERVSLWGTAASRPLGNTAAYAAAGIALLALANVCAVSHRFLTGPRNLDKACISNVDPWEILVQSLVVSPAIEEILISGVLLTSLLARMGTGKAIVSASIAFSLLHLPGDLPTFVDRAAYGALAGALVIRTGTVLLSIAAHMAMNLSLLLLDRMEQGCRLLLTSVTAPVGWLIAWLVTMAVFTLLVRRILSGQNAGAAWREV